MIYQMLLMLPSAAILQLPENGNHYKWDVHSSLLGRRDRERVPARAGTMMPAPEIRPFQFDFLFFFSLSTSLSLPRSFLPALVPSPVQATPEIADTHQSIPYLSHQIWDWNSNLAALHLFPAAAVALSHSPNGCYLPVPFSLSSLISFFCL